MYKIGYKMQLNELLSTPDTLYHYTGIRALHGILSSKSIKLTSDMGTSSEMEHRVGKNTFFLSTARNKTGGYTLGHLYKEGVVLNLDRNVIKSRYKIRSVDYWGGGSTDEQEDRVYSSRPTMPLSVIESIHILLEPRPSGYNPSELKSVLESIVMAKRFAIPVFLYDKRANMLHQRNPVNITEFFKKNSIRSDEKPYSSSLKRTDFLARWRELYYKKSVNELSDSAKYAIDPWFVDADFITQMQSDIHNAKSRSDRSPIEKTMKMFKDGGFKSVAEFRDYVRNKWVK